ncbi:WG repeat-containing protein [Haloimpatiens sp. FM7330]|uniref:WG repeat-containing protein n=1 Tax=Haloimpatiens sp. FM7330 TaxID=3298610 RepID=UPI0036275B38
MWNESWTVCLVLKFIPTHGELIILDKPYKRFDINLVDFDSDGVLEIIAHYKLKEKIYTLVLKNYYGIWYKIANHKLKNHSSLIQKRQEREKNINLYTARVKTTQGEKWGFIDDKGNFMIKPKYDYAYDFQENGLAIVAIGNLYGIIDSRGNYIIKPKYETINQFSEGKAIVVDKDIFKVLDESGKELTKGKYNFIGSYNDGRALFSKNSTASEEFLYGYLDGEGTEVIDAKYKNGSDFQNGKAVVKIKENDYAIIDTNEKLLNSYKYYYVGNLSEGILSFQENSDSKDGYIDEKGNILINPQYTMALPFLEGRAVVNVSEDIENKYGLIDKTGKYMINPKYNDINQLGENRIAVGKALKSSPSYWNSKYSLSDDNGNFLTDFVYDNISNYDKGFASVYDNKNTFFIDKTGKIAKTLPIINGTGTLSFIGDLIQAFVDNRLSYYDKKAKFLWTQNTIIQLNNIYSVREEKVKPNKNYLVYVPQIEGIKNILVQKNINKELKNLSQVKYINPDKQLEYGYGGDFSIQFFKKNLLVLELYGYEFYFGAAHGMPSRIYPHIDLITGKFYELKDLFKENSNYVMILSNIIEKQIKTDSQYNYIYRDGYKGIAPDQPFYVDNTALYIYFTPYEIAPYAAGFPTFKIPYDEIINIIDTKGDFWISFHF